jgi:hypothetical protein
MKKIILVRPHVIMPVVAFRKPTTQTRYSKSAGEKGKESGTLCERSESILAFLSNPLVFSVSFASYYSANVVLNFLFFKPHNFVSDPSFYKHIPRPESKFPIPSVSDNYLSGALSAHLYPNLPPLPPKSKFYLHYQLKSSKRAVQCMSMG